MRQATALYGFERQDEEQRFDEAYALLTAAMVKRGGGMGGGWG